MKIIEISIIFIIIAVIVGIYITVSKKNNNYNIPFLIFTWILLYGVTIFLLCFPGKKLSKDYFLGISQMIGGLFTVIGVYLTLIEEGKIRDKENKNALNQLKEQVRLDHIALLKYDITYEHTPKDSVNVLHELESKNSFKKQKPINIGIVNTGLGSAFNLSYQIIFGTENTYYVKPIVSILEPKDKYNEVMTLEIPAEDEHYHKKITIIIYYEDIYGNNYIQKLEGHAVTTISVQDEKKEIDVDVSLSSYLKAVQVDNDYIYTVPEEEIKEEQEEKELEEKQKILNTIITKKDQLKVQNIINDYLFQTKYFSEIVKETMADVQFFGGTGIITNYERINNKTYLVTYLEGIFGNKEPKLYCESAFKINVVSEDIKLINGEIKQDKSVLSKKDYKKLQKRLKKEIKRIKKFQNIK